MTTAEIIDEIKRLTPNEQAEIARLFGNLNRQLTPEELESLAQRMIDEEDPVKAEALRQELVHGFYGDDLPDA